MRMRPPLELRSISEIVLKYSDKPVYVVGGTLRDALLQRPTHDLDLASDGDARALASRLARSLNGVLVVLDEENGVYRVVFRDAKRFKPWTQIDVAQIQGRDIVEDLARRDFTVNAMAWRIQDKETELLDPRGGVRDLKRRRIHAEIDKVFPEDPLRLLRAFRLAVQLDFTISPTTIASLKKHGALARRPAGERIRSELLGILSSPKSAYWLGQMDRTGLLTRLIPGLEKCRGCAEDYYGKGGVLKHSLAVVDRLDYLLDNLDTVHPDWADDIRREVQAGASSWEQSKALLRLAALLHDIAKPATARRIDGRLRFFHHDTTGAEQAEAVLRDFRFSKDEIRLVSACILHHLRPGNLAANAAVSDNAAFRFFRDVGSHGVALLLVCWADHTSYLPPAMVEKIAKIARGEAVPSGTRGLNRPETQKTLRHLETVGHLLKSYFQRRDRVLPTPLLDGHQVMKILKIASGPAVGQALRKLQEAQSKGKVSDPAQARLYIEGLRASLAAKKTKT